MLGSMSARIAGCALILSMAFSAPLQALDRSVAYLPFVEYVDENNQFDRSRLWVVDLTDGAVLATVAVGPMSGDIQVVDSMARVFVLTRPSEDRSEIVALSTRTLDVMQRIELPWQAHGLEYDEAQELLYTIDSFGRRLVAVDPLAGIAASHNLDREGFALWRIHGTRLMLIVGTGPDGSGDVVWDMETASIRFSLGGWVRTPVGSADGTRIYAPHSISPAIREFDAVTGQWLNEIRYAFDPSYYSWARGRLDVTSVPGVLRYGSGHGMAVVDFRIPSFNVSFELPGPGYTEGIEFFDYRMAVVAGYQGQVCFPILPCNPAPPHGNLWVVDTRSGERLVTVNLPRGGASPNGRFVGQRGILPTPVAVNVSTLGAQLLLALALLSLGLLCYRRESRG